MLSHALIAAAMMASSHAGTSFNLSGQPTPQEAWTILAEGNADWVAGKVELANATPKRVAETAENGQNPFVTILSCSDSRVPVEVVFNRGVGDIFSVRVAGNVADTDEIGSVEYGVGHLHTPLLVVLGHTSCGAVTAVAKGAEVHGSIPQLIDNIQPVVERERVRFLGQIDDAEFVQRCIEANVFQSVEDLIARSSEVRELVQSGKLKIVGAVYDLKTGKVSQLGSHPFESDLIARYQGEAGTGHASKVEDAKPAARPSRSRPSAQANDGGGH